MRRLIALWRLWRVVVHLLVGAYTIRWIFPRCSAQECSVRVQAWSRALLAHMGVELVLTGQPVANGPVLLAANHISWLDIAVMHAAQHCRFIAKSEIKQWPLVGMLATGAGTLYIERASRRDAMRIVHHMAERLQAGDILGVFPEGTTGDGSTVQPFHANLFQAAIAADAPVQPVALAFVDARTGAASLAPCYVGDDTLLRSVWRTLCSPPLQAVVHFAPPQYAQGRDRRAWALDLHAAVVQGRNQH